MLSDTSLPVIKATLPVVGEHIEEIAKRFYKHMFDARPDLLDGLFNRGNQADGRQQQALAGSIAAFAGLLVDNVDQVPDHLLSRVAHKHVSLGLSPDQYQIVHDHLMWAIVDVLGDAVTPEVAAAWDEVYWLMANMLINKERGLYNAVHLTPDTIWRTWRVAERIQETDDVVRFVVERIDEREVKRRHLADLTRRVEHLQDTGSGWTGSSGHRDPTRSSASTSGSPLRSAASAAR